MSQSAEVRGPGWATDTPGCTCGLWAMACAGAWQDFSQLGGCVPGCSALPNCVRDEKTFQQEGWHCELDKTDDDLAYKGVVLSDDGERLLAARRGSSAAHSIRFGALPLERICCGQAATPRSSRIRRV